MVAVLLLGDAGGVGGVGDVDGDRDVGRRARRRSSRSRTRPISSCETAQPTTPTATSSPSRDPPRDLERDVGAEPVVQRARDEAAVRQAERLGGEHGRIADADELLGVLLVVGADVDVHRLDLGRLLAVVGLEQVDRLLADHAGHLAVAAARRSPAGRPGSADPSRRSARTRGSPSSSMWLTKRPISSMWPTIATVGRSSATPTETVEEPSTSACDLAERGGLAPDLGRRGLVAGGRRDADQRVEDFGVSLIWRWSLLCRCGRCPCSFASRRCRCRKRAPTIAAASALGARNRLASGPQLEAEPVGEDRQSSPSGSIVRSCSQTRHASASSSARGSAAAARARRCRGRRSRPGSGRRAGASCARPARRPASSSIVAAAQALRRRHPQDRAQLVVDARRAGRPTAQSASARQPPARPSAETRARTQSRQSPEVASAASRRPRRPSGRGRRRAAAISWRSRFLSATSPACS